MTKAQDEDEMVVAVEKWLEDHPPQLPANVREVLADCAEFLSDIDGDLAKRCEAALQSKDGEAGR